MENLLITSCLPVTSYQYCILFNWCKVQTPLVQHKINLKKFMIELIKHTNHIEKCHEWRQIHDDSEGSNGVYTGGKFYFQ